MMTNAARSTQQTHQPLTTKTTTTTKQHPRTCSFVDLTDEMASTTRRAKKSESVPTILLLIEVLAMLSKVSGPSLSTRCAMMSSMNLHAFRIGCFLFGGGWLGVLCVVCWGGGGSVAVLGCVWGASARARCVHQASCSGRAGCAARRRRRSERNTRNDADAARARRRRAATLSAPRASPGGSR